MRKVVRIVPCVLLLLVILAGTLGFQSGRTTLLFEGSFLGIPYGVLKDSVYSIRFAIYDSSTGGKKLWPAIALYEQHALVIVMGGKLTVELGSSGQPMTDAAYRAPESYVQIWVCQPAGFDCEGFEPVPFRLPLNTTASAAPTTGMGSIVPSETGTHDHWGQTWEGTSLGLKLDNTGPYPCLISLADQGAGLTVWSASGDGVRIDTAGLSGLNIGSAGLDGISIGKASYDGISIGEVGGNGLSIGAIGSPPVSVSPGDVGFTTTESGVSIGGSIGFGLWIGWAGEDGVHVNSALGYGVYARSQNSHALVSDGPALIGGRNLKQIGMLKWYEVSQTGITIDTRPGPRALAFDGEHIWVGHWVTSVLKLRASDAYQEGFYGKFDVFAADRLAFDGHRIWGAYGGEDYVGIWAANARDGSGYAWTQSRILTGDVTGLVFDGAYLWVATYNSIWRFEISAIDVESETPWRNVSVQDYRLSTAALAFDGKHMWAASAGSRKVIKLDPSSMENVGAYDVGEAPSALAFDGAYMWVANRDDGTVTRIRAADGRNGGTFEVGKRPVALVFDGFHIWTANEGEDTITKLRASDGTLVGTYRTGRAPRALVFDGSHVWVANGEDNTLMKF